VVEPSLRKYNVSAGHERPTCGNPVWRIGLGKSHNNSTFNHANLKIKPSKERRVKTYLFDPDGSRNDAPELPGIGSEDRRGFGNFGNVLVIWKLKW
jgi:hypothetical protein